METNQLINKLIELTRCDAVKWNKSYNGMFWLDCGIDSGCYIRKNLLRYKLEFNHIVYRHCYWNLNRNLLKELWISVEANHKRRTDAEDAEAVKEIMAMECPDTRLKKRNRIIAEAGMTPHLRDEAANKASKGLFEK